MRAGATALGRGPKARRSVAGPGALCDLQQMVSSGCGRVNVADEAILAQGHQRPPASWEQEYARPARHRSKTLKRELKFGSLVEQAKRVAVLACRRTI